MPIFKEATAKAGTYTDKQTGQEKTRYLRVGALLDTERGLMLKIDSLPVGFDGWIYMRDPMPKDGAPAKPAPSREPGSDDDIQF